jgi:S1-C subfamily serine protease
MHHLRGAVVAALLAAGCGHGGLVPGTGARAPTLPAGAGFPAGIGTLLYIGLEFPEPGTVIGAQYGGRTFEVRQSSFHITEAVRNGWTRAARLRGESLLHAAGYQATTVGGPTSDVVMVDEDVRFGLQGRVLALDIRTRAGGTPSRSDGRVEVAWEVLDVARGAVVFGRTLEGAVRAAPSIEHATFDALDDALGRLLADTAFQRVLREPPPPREVEAAAGGMVLAGSIEPISVSRGDINPARDSGAIGRVAAGLVTLSSSGRSIGTAFVLTRSGLALTSQRAARQAVRLRVRLPSGVVRPARVIRTHSGLDVALIQIACPETCTTVDWSEDLPAVNAEVLVVAAPLGDAAAVIVTPGRIGGQWGLATGVTLALPGIEEVLGGEPIALATTGRVVAMVAARPGRRSALLLGELLRALRVSVVAGQE